MVSSSSVRSVNRTVGATLAQRLAGRLMQRSARHRRILKKVWNANHTSYRRSWPRPGLEGGVDPVQAGEHGGDVVGVHGWLDHAGGVAELAWTFNHGASFSAPCHQVDPSWRSEGAS